MTKKHYEMIAAAFAATKPEGRTAYHEEQWKYDVVALADVLERDNPRFDCARFYAACGMS